MDSIIQDDEERAMRWVALRRLSGAVDAVAPAPAAEDCLVAVLAGVARRVPVFCAGRRFVGCGAGGAAGIRSAKGRFLIL